MSDAYTPEIDYYLSRLASFSTNIFKLMPQTGATATANQIVRVNLPNNALVNTRSFKFFFNITVSGTGAGGRLPDNLAQLISRYELLCGGVQVSAGCNFHGVLVKAKEALEKKDVDPVLQHPFIVREKSPVDGSTLTGTGSESYASSQQCISDWEGILDTIEPRYISSAELADCTIVIYLADNSVLASAAGVGMPGNAAATDFTTAGAKNAEYTLSNMYFQIECASLNDSVYPGMIQEIIARKGSLDLGFSQYLSWQESTASSFRFGLSCQSLARIIVAHRDANAATQEAPVRLAGAKTWVDIGSGTPATDPNPGIAGDYDSGGTESLPSTWSEAYTTTAANFVMPVGMTGAQLSINSSLYPQYIGSVEDWVGITRNSVLGDRQLRYSLDQHKKNYSVICARLNLQDSEYSRCQSGLNLRGVNGNLYYNMYGVTPVGSPLAVTVFAECNSTLMVGENKQISVIM